eukprot:TRINITY_DN43123_c0_g1_i1.p1 TRINITY_DN43123_c0_g1~~TRINITY_DN43123_c0_g1_i1.p1  ORF type:complete len:237 (+),score=46.61 TRINITY_DN43123_c0_g1_i1:55-765(+)
MNEARGDGIAVCLELPKILKDFSVACRREQVKVGRELDVFGCKYFAEKAGFEVVTETAAQQPPSPAAAPPVEEAEEVKEEEEEIPPREVSERTIEQTAAKAEEEGAVSMEELFEARDRYFSGQRIVTGVLQGSTHDVSIFTTDDRLTLAIKENATGKIYASQLTPQTLPPLIPNSLTPAGFWKGLNTLPPDSVSFAQREYPSCALVMNIDGVDVTVPMADMGDNDVNKEYFEDPFM